MLSRIACLFCELLTRLRVPSRLTSDRSRRLPWTTQVRSARRTRRWAPPSMPEPESVPVGDTRRAHWAAEVAPATAGPQHAQDPWEQLLIRIRPSTSRSTWWLPEALRNKGQLMRREDIAGRREDMGGFFGSRSSEARGASSKVATSIGLDHHCLLPRAGMAERRHSSEKAKSRRSVKSERLRCYQDWMTHQPAGWRPATTTPS